MDRIQELAFADRLVREGAHLRRRRRLRNCLYEGVVFNYHASHHTLGVRDVEGGGIFWLSIREVGGEWIELRQDNGNSSATALKGN